MIKKILMCLVITFSLSVNVARASTDTPSTVTISVSTNCTNELEQSGYKNTDGSVFVAFLDGDGNVIYKDDLPKWMADYIPEAPDKDGYRFTGWKIINDTKGNAVYQAQYEPISSGEAKHVGEYNDSNTSDKSSLMILIAGLLSFIMLKKLRVINS